MEVEFVGGGKGRPGWGGGGLSIGDRLDEVVIVDAEKHMMRSRAPICAQRA